MHAIDFSCCNFTLTCRIYYIHFYFISTDVITRHAKISPTVCCMNSQPQLVFIVWLGAEINTLLNSYKRFENNNSVWCSQSMIWFQVLCAVWLRSLFVFLCFILSSHLDFWLCLFVYICGFTSSVISSE